MGRLPLSSLPYGSWKEHVYRVLGTLHLSESMSIVTVTRGCIFACCIMNLLDAV
jgi:hypothetical protein